MKSSNSNLPLSPAVPAKVHIGSHFDEQQNEIGRTTEAATPRHLPIAYVASASAKLEVNSINILIQSEARAKEAQRTNPPCCYKGPRFSSIAGRLDIGGHHISHCRRIRQTKGAAKRSMIQKANEDSGIKMFFYRLGLHVFASHKVCTHYVYSRVKAGKKVCETAPIL